MCVTHSCVKDKSLTATFTSSLGVGTYLMCGWSWASSLILSPKENDSVHQNCSVDQTSECLVGMSGGFVVCGVFFFFFKKTAAAIKG